MISKVMLVLLLLGTMFYVPHATGQEVEEPAVVHKDELGLNFALAMSGLGVGGFYRKAMGGYSYLGVNANFFIMRDDNEYEYYNAIGIPVKANDINRLFFIPVNLEFKKRLFAEDIEDNFRPHFILQGGIIYGMNFPKLEGLKDEFGFSYDFVIGVGADITNRDKYFISIRPQYRIIYFDKEIAQKHNHSSFEIKVELGGRLF